MSFNPVPTRIDLGAILWALLPFLALVSGAALHWNWLIKLIVVFLFFISIAEILAFAAARSFFKMMRKDEHCLSLPISAFAKVRALHLGALMLMGFPLLGLLYALASAFTITFQQRYVQFINQTKKV